MKQTPMARFGDPQELVGTTIPASLESRRQFHHRRLAFYVDGGFTAMRF